MARPKLLPLKIFLQTFKYAPRLAVGLVVVNNKHEVLLARRAIPPGKGEWHMPGGFVLKGESLDRCIRRIAKKELRVTARYGSVKLLGLFDNLNKDPRGHVVDAVYQMKIKVKPGTTKETQELQFFKKLPARIGFNHGATLRKLGYK
jgi:ADP-ribose pyrophosphatase YjhB (NUDIX family)